MTARSVLVGVFDDRNQAQQAFEELRAAGFSDQQMGFVIRDGNGNDHSTIADTRAAEGAGAGAVVGGSVGALWGFAAAGGLIPGMGPVIAGGALLTILAGAATGATVASVVGFLVGLGVPEEEARVYERELQVGRILLTVKPGDRYDEAATVLRRYHAYTEPHVATPY